MTSSIAIDRNFHRKAEGEERQRTVALLLDVANDPRFALRTHELRDLAEAVRLGGSRIAGWRSIDLQAAFAADTTLRLRPLRRRRLASLLGVLGVLFLFLPIARVGWSFGEVVEAYRQILESGAAHVGLAQAWVTGAGGLATRHHLGTAVAGALTLLGWSLAFFAGRWVLSRSADRVEAEEIDRGTARLARAMTRASNAINSRTILEPADGVDVLTDATAELLRAHQATFRTLEVLDGAVQRLEDSMELLSHGTNAIGKSLGLHTGALQHQISELTQVRASLERLSGLGLVEEGTPERT